MMRIGAKHLTAPKGKKVQMSAQPYRGAPIRTNPTPDFKTDLLGHEIQSQKRTNNRPEAAKGKLRPVQAVFLELIRLAGGMAFMARDSRDKYKEL